MHDRQLNHHNGSTDKDKKKGNEKGGFKNKCCKYGNQKWKNCPNNRFSKNYNGDKNHETICWDESDRLISMKDSWQIDDNQPNKKEMLSTEVLVSFPESRGSKVP